MKQNLTMVLAFWMVVAVLGLSAYGAEQAATPAAPAAPVTPAQAYAGAPPAHWHDMDTDWMKKFHNPMEGVEMGLDIRLREVYTRNLFSLNESWGDDQGANAGNWNNYHWQRYRTRWSTKVALTDDVTFNSRLTWEFWGHCAPDGYHPIYGSIPFLAEQNYDFDEALFDIMNLQFRNAFDLPLTLTVGRQEIILGTGWLVLDGTPGDGSRTISFDAIRAQYDLSETSKLDLIYIQQYDDEEKYIKPFNHHAVQDRRHYTQNNDERGFIAYWTNKLNDMHSNDLYYIYKNDDSSDWANHYKSTPTNDSPGIDADIHTVGTRFFGNLNDNWSYSAEIAKQWGDREGDSLQALGSNNKLMYAFNDSQKNELHVGYEYQSGDDPDTSANEAFDSLWGDWPQFQRGGDLQSYLWAFEGDGLGNVTNLHRLGFGHSFKPSDVWTIATDYNLLWADENTYGGTSRGPAGALNFDTGNNFRGQMISGIATYSCCKNFKTHFMLDYFIPGTYYESPSTDDAYFARVNVEWTF
jgi:hypothetical protein